MPNSLILDNTVAVGLAMISKTIEDATEKSMLARWRREYEAYRARKMRRKAILDAVSEGYDTAIEIAAHTNIPQASVRRILIELVSKNRLQSAKTKNTNNRIELRFELA